MKSNRSPCLQLSPHRTSSPAALGTPGEGACWEKGAGTCLGEELDSTAWLGMWPAAAPGTSTSPHPCSSPGPGTEEEEGVAGQRIKLLPGTFSSPCFLTPSLSDTRGCRLHALHRSCQTPCESLPRSFRGGTGDEAEAGEVLQSQCTCTPHPWPLKMKGGEKNEEIPHFGAEETAAATPQVFKPRKRLPCWVGRSGAADAGISSERSEEMSRSCLILLYGGKREWASSLAGTKQRL